MQHSLPVMTRSVLFAVALCLLVSINVIRGQNTKQDSDKSDDVVRIKSELVQTDVVVLDRKGQFVEGLRPDQFELNIDGKSQTISFFERVSSGSVREASLLSAARGLPENNKTVAATTSIADPTPRGRLIFFFLDDLHLSNASLARARDALNRFVDHRMNPDDQVAIVSSSGQIGFLQQLTDNPAVLHTAIKRLNHKQNSEAYTGKTRISEYMASQVLDNGNRELYAYLLESIKIEQQMGPGNRDGDHRLAASYSAAPYLKNRLRQVDGQGRIITAGTLDALQSLMLSSANLPGRKLVFFLSDGFLINERKSGALNMLDKITAEAARVGAVVYTMDLRGTHFGLGSGVDASTNEYMDASGRRAGMISGELSATREAMQIIADKTGGRAIFNSNSIDDGIQQAIDETSNYYLLAWRPDSDEPHNQNARVKVTVKDRPDLVVRLRSNFMSSPVSRTKNAESAIALQKTTENANIEEAKPRTGEAELLVSLGSLYSQKDLPVAVSVGYVDTPTSEMGLKVSMQVDRRAFNFEEGENSKPAELDVIGAAIDDRGIIATFKQVLTVRPDFQNQIRQNLVIWNQHLAVPPGLYQVRVAVRDRESGRTGSAMQWIEIPNITEGRFDLSSLFLGERGEVKAIASSKEVHPVMVDVDRKFVRSSILRFQTYVYNATTGANGPNVWIQAQILRNKQQVFRTSPALVPNRDDVARLPYWAEISLDQLPAGRYVLQVEVTDRLKNASSSQRVAFSIE